MEVISVNPRITVMCKDVLFHAYEEGICAEAGRNDEV